MKYFAVKITEEGMVKIRKHMDLLEWDAGLKTPDTEVIKALFLFTSSTYSQWNLAVDVRDEVTVSELFPLEDNNAKTLKTAR